MQINVLQLFNFKNYPEARLEFSGEINVLTGANGSGKTNLLDAIHYLSMTRSAFSSSDNHAIRQGEKFFSIKGSFNSEQSTSEILCSVQSGSKKTFKLNGNDYQKLTEHIGKFPVVMIAPDDTDLVREGSEERRKFFDSLISQIDRNYLEALIWYNNALRQRNSLLKLFAENHTFDEVAIQSYDDVLIRTGFLIYQTRKKFIEGFKPVFLSYYKRLVENEEPDLLHQSDLAAISFQEGLAQTRQKDLYLQRTNFGIHRDDYPFTLKKGELKRMGSQGQLKSFIIALKLAQFNIVSVEKSSRPILLLDDIFDKLDESRIGKLLAMVADHEFGQLFITDARPDRTQALLDTIGVRAKIFEVSDGKINVK